mmetsp:Transcript_35207/g.86388  ORF Transcript_35207/g.86388 Transcript_35207/m.86388 type:complete len:322 (-) Transcript_35207:121-1086(-)
MVVVPGEGARRGSTNAAAVVAAAVAAAPAIVAAAAAATAAAAVVAAAAAATAEAEAERPGSTAAFKRPEVVQPLASTALPGATNAGAAMTPGVEARAGDSALAAVATVVTATSPAPPPTTLGVGADTPQDIITRMIPGVHIVAPTNSWKYWLTDLGLEVVPVLGDGNCGFYAGLNMSGEGTRTSKSWEAWSCGLTEVMELRLRLQVELEKNAASWMKLTNEESWHRFLAGVVVKGKWMTMFEMHAMCEVYKANIICLDKTFSKVTVFTCGGPPGGRMGIEWEDAKNMYKNGTKGDCEGVVVPWWVVVYNGVNHYDATVQSK